MSERPLTLKREAATARGARATPTRFESAESALEREQALADAQNPDWDLASRISTAQGALERGVPPEVVRKTYGDKIFADATARRKQRELAHATS